MTKSPPDTLYTAGMVVMPATIYRMTAGYGLPQVWALACGHCGRDFWRFAWFGRPRCPYCGVRNLAAAAAGVPNARPHYNSSSPG